MVYPNQEGTDIPQQIYVRKDRINREKEMTQGVMQGAFHQHWGLHLGTTGSLPMKPHLGTLRKSMVEQSFIDSFTSSSGGDKEELESSDNGFALFQRVFTYLTFNPIQSIKDLKVEEEGAGDKGRSRAA